MTNVKACLAQIPQPLVTISVNSDQKVIEALQLMRDHRLRAILVAEHGKLKGILKQSDCATKLLLPSHSQTP